MVLILVAGLLHAHEVHVDLALIGITLDVRLVSHDHPIVLCVQVCRAEHGIEVVDVVRSGICLVIHVSTYEHRAFSSPPLVLHRALDAVPAVPPVGVLGLSVDLVLRLELEQEAHVDLSTFWEAILCFKKKVPVPLWPGRGVTNLVVKL